MKMGQSRLLDTLDFSPSLMWLIAQGLFSEFGQKHQSF
jgi:hypothetical protein